MFSNTPKHYLFARSKYEEMIACGALTPDMPIELIEGELVEMPPQGSKHATTVTLSRDIFQRIFTENYVVRDQLPLDLGERSQPEPDIAVVVGSPRDFADRHPTTAVLVVEVSDATLKFDQQRKSGVYAEAGISEFWIINLVDQRLEVYREPSEMPTHPSGFGYTKIFFRSPNEFVKPLEIDHSILVSDLIA